MNAKTQRSNLNSNDIISHLLNTINTISHISSSHLNDHLPLLLLLLINAKYFSQLYCIISTLANEDKEKVTTANIELIIPMMPYITFSNSRSSSNPSSQPVLLNPPICPQEVPPLSVTCKCSKLVVLTEGHHILRHILFHRNHATTKHTQ